MKMKKDLMDINEISTKTFKREAGIYGIINILTDQVYIGQSQNIYYRMIFHRHKLKNNSHDNPYLLRSFNKYGSENFKFFVFEYCDNDRNILTEKEKYYISIRDKVYNIRESVKSYNHNNRAPATEESKLKMSNTKKGKSPLNLKDIQELRKRKLAYYLNNELIEIFDSCTDAANYFKIKPKHLNMYIGKRKNYETRKYNSKYFGQNYRLDYYEEGSL